MSSRRLARSPSLYRKAFIVTIAVLILSLFLIVRSTSIANQAQAVITSAVQNLQVDPWGRVVDVTFDLPVTLSFPDDNARFEIDLARPLGRDVNFGVGDLNGDGIADLFGRSFNGVSFFYPGLDSHPFRFGKAQFVRKLNWDECPYTEFGGGAVWEGVAIADFDGDGVKDVVIGRIIYTMVTPDDPTLMKEVHKLEIDHSWDLLPSVGDLDGDGKPDIVMTATYLPKNAYLHRNQSTPGNFSFQRELLTDHYRPESSYEGTRGLSVVDLNNDGLLDLISFHYIYFNQGTKTNPVFDFDNPTAYTVTDGPWVDGVHSDQAISIFMCDGDGDGLVDAYISNYGTSIWQGAFYKNVGTPSSPSFEFQSPILCQSTLYDNSYRGHDRPSFSPSDIYVSTGDVNRDGLLDILVSDGSGTVFSYPTVLWNRSINDSEPHFSCMDIYTFFTDGYPDMNPYGFFTPNWLADMPISWKDYTGDGLEDIIRTDGFMQVFDLSFLERKDDYPVRFYTEQRLKTVTGIDMKGIGLAELDMDNDGSNDFVFGLSNGQLAYHRNLGTNHGLIFDDQVLLTDPTDTQIDVGENSWPAEFDWDGDGDFDLLVGEQSGKISILINQSGKFIDNGYIGAEGWNPLDLAPGIWGGGLLSPSLDAADFNNDQLIDVLGGGHSPPCVWYFENIGTANLPSFDAHVISVDRTIPGYVEKLSEYSYRLYFGIPVLSEETSVFFYENLTENQPTICQISIMPDMVTISGKVEKGDEGVSGVTLTFSNEGGETTTNTNGDYSHTVSYGWSGTATSSKAGYTFFPPSRKYENVTSDQTGQDYTATLLTYTISGNVSLGEDLGMMKVTGGQIGEVESELLQNYQIDKISVTSSSGRMIAQAGLSGVVMNGLPGNPTTDDSGNYSATVEYGWSGTVTPTKAGYAFSSSSRTYTNVISDQADHNYTATAITPAISGTVETSDGTGIAVVTITFSNGGGTTTTDSSGEYSFNVNFGWSGNAIPTKAGYSFSPSSRSYTNVTSDILNQDYAASIIQHMLTIAAGTGGTTDPVPGSYPYDYGTQVSVTAVPSSGYQFSGWSGDASGTTNPITITMDSNKSITANFTVIPSGDTGDGDGGGKKGGCFMATAAYGSPLHPHLDILRDFRDKYLMPSRFGRNLVELYYRYSPSIANFIAKHRLLRVAVRINLLPVITFSYLALNLGPAITGLLLVLIVLIPIFLFGYIRKAFSLNRRSRI